MKIVHLFALLMAMFVTTVISSCGSGQVKDSALKAPSDKYYSDYYVFLAIDESLVVPFDFNWSPTPNGYSREFKSWYGTEKAWPIAYLKDEVISKNVPTETWEHSSHDNFGFDTDQRVVDIAIDGAPKVAISIPKKSTWTALPKQLNNKEIFAFKTSLKRAGETVRGWVIYERIRWDEEFLKNFGDFKAFYWIPLVANGDLYHFERHSGFGAETATRWSGKGGKVIVDTLADFTLEILDTERDARSGRNDIPKSLRLAAPEWNLDVSLTSKGSQVGYGAEFPKGLAYYRQSILLPDDTEYQGIYGMLELILEGD